MLFKNKLRRIFYKFIKQPGYAFTVLGRRMLCYFSYYLGNGKSLPPESITIFLTQHCNLNCHMCGQWGRRGVNLGANSRNLEEELSFEQLGHFIEEVAAFKPNITLFGGEPLLYKGGCVRLINFIKKYNLHCLMITNGSLIKENAQELVLSKLDELNISLDGTALVHDKIRNQAGLFERIISGIEKINHFKSRHCLKKPLVSLQCTINAENYKFIDEILPIARKLKVDSVTFHNLIFVNQQMLESQHEYDRLLNANSKAWEGFLFTHGLDLQVLEQKIKSIFSSARGLNVDLYPNFSSLALKEYYRNPQKVPRGFYSSCISPWIATYLFCDGQIKPCLNSSYSFGNIKNTSFAEIWNSQPAVNFRRVLRKNKIFPVCPKCTELYRY
jgi:MoaA/NifB/PqqE/SkfB family radical SAM enzyme